MTEKQIITQEEMPRTEKQISLYYGERSEIRELVDRMRAGLPNAMAIPDSGIRALATAAYAHDLDPWNGEIWVIYNEKKGETSLMAGVKGLRKAAKRQLEERHHYYLSFTPILEYAQYGLDTPDQYGRPVELAEICELRRGDACEQYSKTLRQIFDMCSSFETARDMLGPMPVYIGIGVVRQGEKSKMERCQLVKKRAEADALKRAFDLPFSDRVSGNGGSVTVGNAEGDAIESEYEVMNGKPKNGNKQAEQPQSQPAEMPDRPMGPEQLRDYFTVRTAGPPANMTGEITAKQLKVANGLVKGLFKGSATQDKDAAAYLDYLKGIKEVSDLGKYAASILIDLIKADGDDQWGPSDVAKEEAQRVLRLVYKAQGQKDMFDPDDDEDPPADEPKSGLDKAFSRDKDGNPIDDKGTELETPEIEEKATVSAQEVKTENKAPVKPKQKAKKAEKKAEEKPVPAKDNGEDPQLLALKRSKPSSWVVAAEWLKKNFKVDYTAGQLREAVAKKMGITDPQSVAADVGWPTALEIGQAAGAK